MARVDPKQPLMPSILDRLTDPDSEGTAWRRGYDLAQMVEAVRRDLESLLNTRQSHQGLPSAFVEMHRSIVTYGLPDFSSVDAGKLNQRQEMGTIIEGIVAIFEPRLRDVRAIPVDSDAGSERRVRFHIDARLRVDPSPEVGFETVVELSSGHASIRPRDE